MAQEQAQDETERQAAEHRAEPLQHRHGDGADQVQRLTVSEIFPIEIRAEALAVFFAIAQVVGAVGPAFYGVLIGNGASRTGLAIGYVVGGGIMIIGGLVEIVFGIDAEGKPLEQIAAPLTVIDG